MKFKTIFCFILLSLLKKIPAQQNWVGIPCYKPISNEWINRIFVDSLHNELILNTATGYSICGVRYKGLVAYNGNNFHDLDFGIDKHDPNLSTGGNFMLGCIPYNGKTLFGGGWYSVGSNTLYAKSIALWNGTKWDNFPNFVFPNDLSNRGGAISGFLRYQNKLWLYGGFDTIGNTITKNFCSFDGNNFAPVAAIPDYGNDYIITKAIVYKNKIITTGNFYDPNTWSAQVAMYDGNNWSSVGTGIKGSFSAVMDMAIYKDTLYIAGSWAKADGNVSNHIMKWDGNQLYDAGFGNFYSWAGITNLVVYRDRLYAFGPYDHATNIKAYGIASYENGKWTVPKDSIGNYGVRYGAVYNDALYIAGAFKNIGKDTSIINFARLECPDFDAATGCLSGIKENNRNRLNLKVFPNPSNDKLFIEADYNVKVERMSMTNALGQLVISFIYPENKQELDISTLPNGIYFLKAVNKQGQSVFKFVKE